MTDGHAHDGHPAGSRDTRRARSWSLAFAVLGSSAAWSGHLVVTYSVVPTLCAYGLEALFLVFTLACLALAIASGVVALGSVLSARISELLSPRRWRGARDEPLASASESDRSLGLLGLVLASVFVTAIVFQSAPVIGLDPCVSIP